MDDEFDDDDGGIERHNVKYRINPSGHKEMIIKKKGQLDDETLNELKFSIDKLLESMFNKAMSSKK